MHQPSSVPFASPALLLSAIVDSSDDAIVSKNLEGVITSWNAGAQRMFGYTPEEAVGRPVTMLIPPDRQDEETLILGKLRRGERVDHFETIRVRKDGSLLQVSLTISPVKDTTGRVVGASKIARDITLQKRAGEEVRAALDEAERQSRIKDEFVATLSHELRTPLQSILGWTQLLRDDSGNPAELAEGLEIIERNTLAQMRIVEDLLDMNRILSGKVRLDLQPVRLDTVISEAVETVKPAAAARDVSIEVTLDPLSSSLHGDPARLRQILWNLLSNAIRFTPKGGLIKVSLFRIDSHLEVSVSDNGEGIDPQFLPFVFDRFRQGDASTTRAHGGLGLGLAIVKNLTELHGGSVSVRSAGKGTGATFSLTLPLPALSPETIPDENQAQDPSSGAKHPDPKLSLTGVKILVIDDEADARALLTRILTRAGAQVNEAGSVQAGLDSLREELPAIIISDIGLPGRDGFDFIRTVRAFPPEKGGAIPAIALTAYSRTQDRIQVLSAGFQMHLPKPADVTELLTVVTSVLGRV